MSSHAKCEISTTLIYVYVYRVKIEIFGYQSIFRLPSALNQNYVHSGSYSLSLFRCVHSQKEHLESDKTK